MSTKKDKIYPRGILLLAPALVWVVTVSFLWLLVGLSGDPSDQEPTWEQQVVEFLQSGECPKEMRSLLQMELEQYRARKLMEDH